MNILQSHLNVIRAQHWTRLYAHGLVLASYALLFWVDWRIGAAMATLWYAGSIKLD